MDCIAVVGAGAMGRGIVQVSAAAGFRVKVLDAAIERAREGSEFAAGMLRRAAAKGHFSMAAASEAISRIEICRDMAELQDASLVIEAAVEDIEVKQTLFRELEAVVDSNAILATNTSSLMVTQLASACRRPQRVAGLHFFNPVPLMKVVEVIPGLLTDATVIDRLTAYVTHIGHASVRSADTPGFLVNHAGRAFYTEGIRVVSEGAASIYDVDRVARDALGFRMGPFELFDHTGLDVSYPVLTKIYHQFFEEPRFRPHPFLTRQFVSGAFGRKTGRGFYEYRGGTRIDPTEQSFGPGDERPVWIDARQADAMQLRTTLESMAITIDDGKRPHAESVVMLSPLGKDATTAGSVQDVPLTQCMAIDTMIWPVPRVTVMPTISTAPEYRDSLRGMLVRRGLAVTMICDCPGFIGQRMLASIVNLACDIAQQRIASPEDIDRAVRLGLGYPKGPLAWGTELGGRRILEILENLYEFYGDPRYRPSPWLKRRVTASVPLATPDS